MNFQNIKTKFILHLKETAYGLDQSISNLDISDESIFTHQEEFKQFLKDEYHIVDNSLATISVNDILKMNIVDGKLVDKSKQNEEETEQEENKTPIMQDSNNQGDTPTEENTENGWLSGLVNDLFENETFKNSVDADENGEVDETELGNFLNYIKDFDGNGDSISISDIFTTLESIKNGTFELGKPIESGEQTSDTTDASDSSNTPTNTPTTDNSSASSSSSSSGSSSGGHSSNSSSGGSGGDTSTATDNNTTPKNIEDMTADELETKLQTTNQELSAAQDELSKYQTGSEPSSEEMDNAYKAYTDAIGPDKKAELDAIKTKITEKEVEIANKTNEAITQQGIVAGAEIEYNNAKNKREALEAKLSKINENDPEQAKMKSGIESEITTAKANEETAQEAYETAKAELERINNEKAKREGELETLNTEFQTKETEVTNGDEQIKTLQEAYDTAKQAYDTKKAEGVKQAQDTIQAKSAEIVSIKTQQQKIKDTSEIDEKYKTTPDLFDPNAKLNMEYIEGDAMNYLLISPDNVDPNEELPVLVYLHGSGEVGGGEGATKKQFCPGGFMKNWGLNTFKGYVIVPVLKSGSWSKPKVEQNMRTLLDNFSKTHKVNKNKIALSGASLGGQGAVYLAGHMSDVFCRTAALSAYSSNINPKDLVDEKGRSRIRGYYGSRDDHNSINYMNKAFASDTIISLNGVKHCDVPKKAFGQDLDGDKCSDLIQWLFED